MKHLPLKISHTVGSLYLLLLICWPITVYAASQNLGATFGLITVGDWVVLVLLSCFSGAVALLQRMKKSFEYDVLVAKGQTPPDSDKQLIDWRVFALCHMAGALFTGFITFLVCEAFDRNTYSEAAIIALMSWSGAKVADKLADGVSDGVVSRIASFFGNKGTT